MESVLASTCPMKPLLLLFHRGLTGVKYAWLKEKSVVDCFQIRAVSHHNRFTEKLGELSNNEIDYEL